MKNKKRSKESGSVSQELLIYQRIFDAILEQKLAPGARLTEEPLGEIFGVSRTIIRRSLLRLSHEGIIELIPHKGARVVITPIEQVADYFTARQVVECAIAHMATGRGKPYQIDALRALIVEEKRYFESGTRGKGLSASSEFHLQIVAIANNAPLADFARQLISRTALIVSQYQDTSRAPCVYQEHDTLIDALDGRSPDLTERLMAEHIQHIQDTLVLKNSDTAPDLFKVFNELEET